MITYWLSVAGLLVTVASAQQATPQCQDVHTESCRHFHDSRPDLCSDPTFADSMCKRFCGNCPLECHSCDHPVRNPKDCNTTAICDPKSQCAVRHLKATDGHHEYLMTCESKELCDLVAMGFGFGKRRIDDMDKVTEEERIRFEREVMMSCCGTDLCNIALVTAQTATQTTTQATTQATTQTIGTASETATSIPVTNLYSTSSHGSVATTTTVSSGACHKDVVFMIDDSGSVGRTNFQHSVDFVSQLVSHMPVGQTGHGAQVSVMAFSGHPQIEWYLDSYHTQTDLQNALKHRVKYVSGTANIGDALDAVRTKILRSQRGDRHDAENVVVLLTDSTSKDPTFNEAHNLHSESHDVISIGIGRDPSDLELDYIATDRQHTFHIASYSQLPNIAQHVLSLICN